ncbi:MAG: sulfatase-like hydrolase/transferase [Planctomycetaceae bacterium]|nr:sulfatase-like hydrolase/transferase [Planctomycetaceae bacterium]
MVRRPVLLFALALTTTWALERAPAADRRPNIVLLVADDQRPDTIAALGNPVIQTPSLDRLVQQGTVVKGATCANPICTPSRAEILTGCSGFRMGVLDFGGTIDRSVPSMARWLQTAGYSTWYVGKWHNSGRPTDHGYQASRGLFGSGGGKYAIPQTDYANREVTGYRGWIFQDDERNLFPEQGVGLTPNISSAFADAAISVISEQAGADRPFFLHVNFTAPHDPLMLPPGWEMTYTPEMVQLPPNFLPEHPFDHGNLKGRDELLFQWPRTHEETRRELAAYYAVISHLDQQIGRILDSLEQTQSDQNTIVVFTSDHGLAIGSHGLRGKQNMYEHTIGVPLILRGPGIRPHLQLDADCYLRDLFPTLCELAGVTSPESQIDGRSLVPVLTGDAPRIHDFITGYFRDSQRMIRSDGWKYIRYPVAKREQLFNLQTDPYELSDLSSSADHASIRKRLSGRLDDWLDQWTTPVSN